MDFFSEILGQFLTKKNDFENQSCAVIDLQFQIDPNIYKIFMAIFIDLWPLVTLLLIIESEIFTYFIAVFGTCSGKCLCSIPRAKSYSQKCLPVTIPSPTFFRTSFNSKSLGSH